MMKPLRTSVFFSLLLAASSVFTPNIRAQERRTPLGVERPVPGSVPGPPVTPARVLRETAVQAVARALAAHGAAWITGQVQDWAADGTLTYFTAEGPQATFNVTLLRKGDRQVQRIVKQQGMTVKEGSNGTQSWLSAGAFSGPAGKHLLHFIESQTVRSTQSLFKHQAQGLVLRDAGEKGDSRTLEAEDRGGNKTSYFIDAKTSAVTKLEFVTGQSRDPFSGRMISDTETYVFSDFRKIQGLLTPFKIERFINGLKLEAMQFSSVSYNKSLKDNSFRP